MRRAYATLGWEAPGVLAHLPPDDELYYDQLLLRRAALTAARIPVFTRFVAGAANGKAPGLVAAFRNESA